MRDAYWPVVIRKHLQVASASDLGLRPVWSRTMRLKSHIGCLILTETAVVVNDCTKSKPYMRQNWCTQSGVVHSRVEATVEALCSLYHSRPIASPITHALITIQLS